MANTTDNPLELYLPPILARPDSVVTDPQLIEVWIEQLPVANTMEVAKRLLQVLRGINRTRIPPVIRLNLAGQLAKPITNTLFNLEQRYLDSTFPLTETNNAIIEICQQLREELACAYKHVANDLITADKGDNSKRLLLAVVHAFLHLGYLAYQRALIYEFIPESIWHELHRLFAFAHALQWATVPIKIPVRLAGSNHENEQEMAVTLRDLYLRVLLFALATPQRLRQREIRILYRDTLPIWVTWAQLDPCNLALAPAATRFLVQLNKRQMPVHSTLIREPSPATTWVLDTETLIEQLKVWCANQPQNALDIAAFLRAETLPTAVVQRLITAWSSMPQRRFRRTRLRFSLDIVVGLRTLCQIMNQGKSRPAGKVFSVDVNTDTLDSNDNSYSDFQAHSHSPDLDLSLGLTSFNSNDPGWNRSFGPLTERETGPAPNIWAEKNVTVSDTATATVNTLNESIGGYCVRWQGKRLPGIKIGEVVGVHMPETPSSYGLAVVRWMRYELPQSLQVGLELLASSSELVSIRLAAAAAQVPVPGLLLPASKNSDRPASLVIPISALQVGDSVYMSQGETQQRVRLSALLDATGMFAQFQFQPD